MQIDSFLKEVSVGEITNPRAKQSLQFPDRQSLRDYLDQIKEKTELPPLKDDKYYKHVKELISMQKNKTQHIESKLMPNIKAIKTPNSTQQSPKQANYVHKLNSLTTKLNTLNQPYKDQPSQEKNQIHSVMKNSNRDQCQITILDILKEKNHLEDNYDQLLDYHFSQLIRNYQQTKEMVRKFRQETYQFKIQDALKYHGHDNEQRRDFIRRKRLKSLQI